MHPDDRERVLADWNDLTHVTDVTELDYRIVRADGQIVHVRERRRARRRRRGSWAGKG